MENVKQSLRDRLILDISAHLTSTDSLSIRKFIPELLEKLCIVFDADRAILYLTHPDETGFSAAFEWQGEGIAPVKDELQNLQYSKYPLWEKFAIQKRVFRIADISNIPDIYMPCKEMLLNIGAKAFLQVPLMRGSQLEGFISIYSSRVTNWNKDDVNFFETIARITQNITDRLEISDSEKKGSRIFPWDKNSLQNKILESLDFGLLIYDCKVGDFIFSNSRCIETLGMKNASTLNKESVFRLFRENGLMPEKLFVSDSRQNTRNFSLIYDQKNISGALVPITGTSWLTVSFYDITPIVQFDKNEQALNEQLKILSESAIKLLSTKNDDIYKFIGETAFALQSDAIVIVNSYNEAEGFLKPQIIKGINSSTDIIIKLLGKHPINKKFPVSKNSPYFSELLSSRLKEIKGGISELSMGTISEPVAEKIETILGTGKYYGCGLFANGKLYGTIILLLPPDSFVHPYIFETFSQLASKTIHGIKMSRKLQNTKTALWNAAAIAKLGYWQYDVCSQNLIIDKGILKDFNKTGSDEKILIPIDRFLNRYASEQDRRLIKEKFENVGKNIKNTQYTVDLEWKFLRKNKPPLHLYTRGVVQPDGRIMGIAQDITRIREAEQNLKESEVKFKNLIRQSLDPIVIIQDDGRITEWNSSSESISGISAESAIGQYIWDIESEITFKPIEKEDFTEYPKDKFKEHFFRFFDADKSKKPTARDISIKTREGELKYLTVTSFVFNDNNRKYLCRIFKDITLEKEKQNREKEQEIRTQANKAKELFLDNMNHEMRTPLSGIIGMTDLLMRSGLTPKQTDLLKVVKESSDNLLELISNIHQLSAIEAHGIVIQRKPFRPADLLDKTLGIFKAAALQKQISLFSDISNIAHLQLVGDEFRLQQILTNLIANAIKFTSSNGKVTVVATANPLQGNSTDLKISIKDTGIGIPREKIPILFDKFTQADSSYTREHEGAGIGLAISKELIELMGGTIGVNSEYMRGAEFWIRLTLPNVT
ncbi:MAG: PAS domain S-box protein [Bacteroidales bacterium]|nr:PAS domain S-box protein [Bacteroidales bacterium]